MNPGAIQSVHRRAERERTVVRRLSPDVAAINAAKVGGQESGSPDLRSCNADT